MILLSDGLQWKLGFRFLVNDLHNLMKCHRTMWNENVCNSKILIHEEWHKVEWNSNVDALTYFKSSTFEKKEWPNVQMPKRIAKSWLACVWQTETYLPPPFHFSSMFYHLWTKKTNRREKKPLSIINVGKCFSLIVLTVIPLECGTCVKVSTLQVKLIDWYVLCV